MTFKTVLLTAALTLATASAAWAQDSTGVTDDTVLLGSFTTLSGPRAPLSIYNRQIEAYFKDVNDKGGVRFGDGKTRKILFKLVDTGGQPARAVAVTRELVERDKVFALLSPLGQNENLAISDYVQAKKVPHIFLNTVSTIWGADAQARPWSIGYPPAPGTQTGVILHYLKAAYPNAKVALLTGNDESGKELAERVKQGLEGSGLQVVAAETYEYNDTTVDSQIIKLAASGADVFLNLAIGRPALQALQKAHDLGWKPVRFVETSSSSSGLVRQLAPEVAEGIFSTTYFKDPNQAEFKNDPAILRYFEAMDKHFGAGFDRTAAPLGAGQAEAFIHVAQQLNPVTREALIEAVRSLKDVENPILLPGIVLNTSATDGFPIEQMQIAQFKDGGFQRLGEVIYAPSR